MSPYDRHDWLALRTEAALDADRPIVDAHHHLWERDDSVYLTPDLIVDAASHNVTHTVFVECSAGYRAEGPARLRPVGETVFVAGEAERLATADGPRLAAIVGFVDMTLGDAVEEVLDAHVVAGGNLFRGVRHGTNWSPDSDIKNGHHNPTADLMDQPDFRAGVRRLGELGHSFDAWLYHPQLSEFAALARATPGTQFILDHLGGPLGIGRWGREQAQMRAMWRTSMADVAACPNVMLKVGGLGMDHYFGTGWANLPRPPGSEEVAAHWRDMVERAIDLFGPDRCMFESNFPVDRQTVPYSVLWNAFKILASPYLAAEQDALFRQTAAAAYRIDLDV